MLGKIELKGMKFHAFHGCLKEEQLNGNDFLVDIEFQYDFEQAAREDDLSKAVDYGIIYKIVAAQMEIRSDLLENLVWRIRRAVSEAFPQISGLRVKVFKPNPPVDGSVSYSSAEL